MKSCSTLSVLYWYRVITRSIIATFFITLSTNIVAAPDLVLNTGHNPPLANDLQTGFHDLITHEVYKRLGMEVEIYRLPSARSGRNADMGIDDGNGPRIDGYQKYFPNLLLVPEKVIDFDFVGFTTNPDINPKNWDGLEDLNVGIVTGWKILEVNIKKYQSLVKVRNTQQLFKLLKLGRVDIVLIERWQGLYAAKQLDIKQLHVIEPPFAQKAMYFHLHKKHQSLVDKVAGALREVKVDGTYDLLMQQTLQPLTAILKKDKL